MAAPVTLYLVRHGVAEEAEGRCVGHTDLPLAPAGRDALARLAAEWPAPRPPRLVSSDLARARESARVLAEGWGRPGPVATDARLREMDFGRWEGRTWGELEREDGAAFGEWMADWQKARVPGGEGFGDVIARVEGWLEDELTAARLEGVGEVAVVAHAGSIRAVLVHAFGMSREAAFRVRLDYGRVTGLRVAGGEAGRAELLVVNAGWGRTSGGWCCGMTRYLL